ncbi:hypothetical protein [Nitrospirillum viridazoti]|uniref:Uncharacterized protein n=1 Tax=Nitrospirillum viridazoti CBAmc TaxID=1441467 RepID=A0A248JU35_9PROT|nr:hypothetical protein [Nitrospirillum amazonense]ASG22036.1 hypothetical protein Y958_13665 [Nitrospirillum amazonense CBAmc]TWB39809.1 hypothetical protein FBZ91_10542 [Nitrospirillum amazonense]
MALDGVLSTGSAYAQIPSGTLATLGYATNDTSAEATSAGSSASGSSTPGAAPGGTSPAGEETTSRLSAPAYISPVVTYDSQAAIAITQFRDSTTGAVDYQIPSRHVVEQYRLRATGAPHYKGGNPLLPAEVAAPSNDQPVAGAAGPSSTSPTAGTAGPSSTSTGGGGSGSALISPTVAAVTLGAAAVNVVA